MNAQVLRKRARLLLFFVAALLVSGITAFPLVGMIACMLVVPLALICGPLRGIPFFWRLIDCSFGILGFIPLWMARKDIQRIAALEKVVWPSV